MEPSSPALKMASAAISVQNKRLEGVGGREVGRGRTGREKEKPESGRRSERRDREREGGKEERKGQEEEC